VYGVDFTVGGQRYELRAGKVAAGAAFRLFHRVAADWVQVATVSGGYGTTGQSVVASIPVALLGNNTSIKPTNPVAFSSVGSLDLG